MSSSESDSASVRASSPSSHPDSPVSESNVWVDVQPPSSPGPQGQQRTSTSSAWSIIPQAPTQAPLLGSGTVDSPYDITYSPSTMSAAGSLASIVKADIDAGTHREPSSPGTSAAQTNTRSQSRDTSQEDLYTQHDEPSHPRGDNAEGFQAHGQQQQQRQQPWTWKTLLLIEDEADEVDLGAYSCAAITLHEEDIASPAALRYKVCARLWRLSVQAGRPHRAQDFGEEPDPDLDISIGWDLATGGEDDGRGRVGGAVGGSWSVTHRTPLALSNDPLAEAEGEGEGEGEGEEMEEEEEAEAETAAWLREEEEKEEEAAAWLRENMELAASGRHGRAVLVARIVPRLDPTLDMEEAYRTGGYV